jgi:hypothetical protein
MRVSRPVSRVVLLAILLGGFVGAGACIDAPARNSSTDSTTNTNTSTTPYSIAIFDCDHRGNDVQVADLYVDPLGTGRVRLLAGQPLLLLRQRLAFDRV